MNRRLTIEDGSEETEDELILLLMRVLPCLTYVGLSQISDPRWASSMTESYPALGGYIVEANKANIKLTYQAKGLVRLELPRPAPGYYEHGVQVSLVDWDGMISGYELSLAMALVGGGSSAFATLLKGWVEEEPGRRSVRVMTYGSDFDVWASPDYRLAKIFEDELRGTGE